ncbi:MAG: hypothetical protein C4293_20020 [Nitrospiraceae bacterium]
MEKACEHCGRSFFCEQAAGCWCWAVKLDQAQLAWLEQNFNNCLCPTCLAAVGTGTLTAGQEGKAMNPCRC